MPGSFNAFGIVWSVVFLLFFVVPAIFRWIRRRTEIQDRRRRAAVRSIQQINSHDEQGNNFRWVMPLGASRFMSSNQQQQQQQQQQMSFAEQSRRRKEFIRETLVLRKVIVEDSSYSQPQQQKSDLILQNSSVTMTPPQTDSELSEMESNATSNSNFSAEDNNDDTPPPRLSITPPVDDLNGDAAPFQEDDEDTRPACTICFNEYKPGDEICWSNHPQCNHMFHKDCIEEWLLRHDECPCCRLNYMLPKEVGSEMNSSEMEEMGNPSSSNHRHHHHHHHRSTTRQQQQQQQQRQRVPPLSSDQNAALANGSIFTSDEESFVNMLATIEQLYRQAQVRLYYDGTTPGNNTDRGTGTGPRIVSLPMPSVHSLQQQHQQQQGQGRNDDTPQIINETSEVNETSDVEMGTLTPANEEGVDIQTTTTTEEARIPEENSANV
ncbi:unnamed protein product [Cylindrotheca closterium]|uniref:RING-type domain-containing protein n=1 Tax=Cylindrotheca closterium TaxID=2856 RepID=A0AAD2FP77_9STRA|nr:unnamed protein product [Cylindrotheca closterium]